MSHSTGKQIFGRGSALELADYIKMKIEQAPDYAKFEMSFKQLTCFNPYHPPECPGGTYLCLEENEA